MGPNNANAGRSGRKNAVFVDSTVGNKGQGSQMRMQRLVEKYN